MSRLVFIDTEINPKNGNILDLGAIDDKGATFHKNSILEFEKWIQNADFVIGHNIIHHDLQHIKISPKNVIDTLYLSPLLFPKKPYHRLLKDEKFFECESNNPLSDSIKAKELFYDCVNAFGNLDLNSKKFLYTLLYEVKEFAKFFDYVEFSIPNQNTENIELFIKKYFKNKICENSNLKEFVNNNPIELAYTLALINSNDKFSITPYWVQKQFPLVHYIFKSLRNVPCLGNCHYCRNKLNAKEGLKTYFGYDDYRLFGGKPLQEDAVQTAIRGESLLAVFPTGGGKSITFQVPALMAGENEKGLTVVISPLQSLMKDQVDNLEKQGITEAGTINNGIDTIERAKMFELVENGQISILYISPESLRSNSIERLLLKRNVVRFVVDEAHCFSAWGQDFRPDYLYIGIFIKEFCEKKNLSGMIPVSCFTATARQKVIEDIRYYFKEKLGLNLKVFSANPNRINLTYKILECNSDTEKYNTLRELLESKKCPTIVYCRRTKSTEELAEWLCKDGFKAIHYHGQMEKDERKKNQDLFMSGEINIVVATTAFGMGVDKKDISMVIHYEISDSLENYVQEAGRAGRDPSINANCFVLFNENDIDNHFSMLNQTKLTKQEINQIWTAIKLLTKARDKIKNSALEIARKAGWDEDKKDIEPRVTTAITALEESGYVKRDKNFPRIFANSILVKNMEEAVGIISNSAAFADEKQKESAKSVIQMLIAARSRAKGQKEVGEERIDYIADRLGMETKQVKEVIDILRLEKILNDDKDLTIFFETRENKAKKILDNFSKIEKELLKLLTEMENYEKVFKVKELNEKISNSGISCSVERLKILLNYLKIQNCLEIKFWGISKNSVSVLLNYSVEKLLENEKFRYNISGFILEYLWGKKTENNDFIQFSIMELQNEFNGNNLFEAKINIKQVEDALYYLSKIEAIKIEGGFLVVYNRLQLEKLEKDNKIKFKDKDYENLYSHYESRIQQIHIIDEYAKKCLRSHKTALEFVEDYFKLNSESFLSKYFNGRIKELSKNITSKKFNQLFGTLSDKQLEIINDKSSELIVVAAGPGSGKTKVLVHKLASLLLLEDIKAEQLQMLTFSRVAATEFKKRLIDLVGKSAAHFVSIKTFHSFSFDILGIVGHIDKNDKDDKNGDDIIRKAVEKINSGDIEVSKITKSVLVLDEAQDMSEYEYSLVKTLINKNENLRVIAVGDDDQNIYEWRKSNSEYFNSLITEYNAKKYELSVNYRSKKNLVQFSNDYIAKIKNRMKTEEIIPAQGERGKIKITNYSNKNLITPLIKNILDENLSGSTCVLTTTNENAAKIVFALLKNNYPAKLIQDISEFGLSNMVEVRGFIELLQEHSVIIEEESLKEAKRIFKSKFERSDKYEICHNIIKDFENVNEKFYKNDFEIFVKESKFEDFVKTDTSGVIYVSTIHKAKGKEFDNVFLHLENYSDFSDKNKRAIYVAITRARNNLYIHEDREIFTSEFRDAKIYPDQNEILLTLSHKEVYLDYFQNSQKFIDNLQSGDDLIFCKDGCYDKNGHLILKFSNGFRTNLQIFFEDGYKPKSAKVNFILYWKKKEDESKEIKIVLPSVVLIC